MKRRSIYDWKSILLLLCFIIPISPLFRSAAGGGTGKLAEAAIACVILAAVVSERVSSLFFHHILSTMGGMIWASRKNISTHIRDSLLAMASAFFAAASIAVQGRLAGIAFLAASLVSFMVFLWSVFVLSGILCLYREQLQYGSFLYRYSDIKGFDIRDCVLDLDLGSAHAHCGIHESFESAERLKELLDERCQVMD